MSLHQESVDPGQPGGRAVLSWDGFGVACADLARQVAESGFRPSVIIAVARGGLLPAGALTYALDVKLTDAINVEFYTDAQQTRPDPILLAPMLDTDSIAGQQLLVVDDVADSGRTLSLVMKLLRGFGADVRSAVLFAKSTTIIEPDFVHERTDDWVDFPWSLHPSPELGGNHG